MCPAQLGIAPRHAVTGGAGGWPGTQDRVTSPACVPAALRSGALQHWLSSGWKLKPSQASSQRQAACWPRLSLPKASKAGTGTASTWLGDPTATPQPHFELPASPCGCCRALTMGCASWGAHRGVLIIGCPSQGAHCRVPIMGCSSWGAHGGVPMMGCPWWGARGRVPSWHGPAGSRSGCAWEERLAVQRGSQEISSPLILIVCDGREIYGSKLRFVRGSSTRY